MQYNKHMLASVCDRFVEDNWESPVLGAWTLGLQCPSTVKCNITNTCLASVCDRFVEDNWESPVLGAWGLGWEVWLDGMEVTQFTYFQQAGGKVLDVPAVEITYGLERILMSLQGVKHFKDIR